MVLERNQRVELRPTIQQLFDMIQKVSRDLITVIQMVPRLALQLTARQRRELEVGISEKLLSIDHVLTVYVSYSI
jgi:dynein heavy chain